MKTVILASIFISCVLVRVSALDEEKTRASGSPEPAVSKEAEPKKGKIIIGLDLSQWLHGIHDDPNFFERDSRFRNSGGPKLYKLFILPEKSVKQWVDSTRKAKGTLLEGSAILDPVYAPAKFDRASIPEELRIMTERLAVGERLVIPLFKGVTSVEDPLRLQVAPGRYYLFYGVQLIQPNQFGWGALAWHSVPGGRPGEWGPISITVQSDEEVKLTVKPCALTASRQNLRNINDYIDFLIENDIAP